jgi:hypothetical protein
MHFVYPFLIFFPFRIAYFSSEILEATWTFGTGKIAGSSRLKTQGKWQSPEDRFFKKLGNIKCAVYTQGIVQLIQAKFTDKIKNIKKMRQEFF